MKNISFIITLFFIVSLSSLEKISAQPYTIKRLGMEDGLSSNYTQKIIQDQKGYIWVATSSGLNRFDGQKFILYGQDNHKTEQNWINGLLAPRMITYGLELIKGYFILTILPEA